MKFILALLLSAFAFTASAQEQDPNVLVTYLDVNCFKDITPILQDLTATYGEKPLFVGKGPLPIANFYRGEPDYLEGVMMMYVNQETGTFTNMILFADGSGCQIFFGKDFTPALN